MNRITGPGSAIIDGKFTGLAGCADAHNCSSASTCIRADSRLTAHRSHMAAGSIIRVQSCSAYIRAGASLAALREQDPRWNVSDDGQSACLQF